MTMGYIEIVETKKPKWKQSPAYNRSYYIKHRETILKRRREQYEQKTLKTARVKIDN